MLPWLAVLLGCGSETPSPLPESSVPEAAWRSVDGIDWATNGHVLVRRDGVQPDDAMSEISWRTDLDASQIRPVVTLPSSVIALSAAGTQSDGEMLVARFERASDQQMVNLDAVYAKVLTGAIVQGSGALDPVYAVDESGAVQAVVMPRTP